MNKKQFLAKKIALTKLEEMVFVCGWDDALEMTSGLLTDLGRSDLALLVRAIGSATVNEKGEVGLNV